MTPDAEDPIGGPGADPPRPDLVVVVAGTGTEVGKTWVSVRVVELLREHGLSVTARKPAQSFDDGDTATDADLLAAATGDDPNRVCPPYRWYPVPMAPPMAADALDRGAITLAALIAETAASWHDRRLTAGIAQVGLVELAGGPWSPIAHDGDGIDLTRALAPDIVVLVADAGLGTINAVRPAAAALAQVAPVVVLLNRFDESSDLHTRNLRWLVEHDTLAVVDSPAALAQVLLALR